MVRRLFGHTALMIILTAVPALAVQKTLHNAGSQPAYIDVRQGADQSCDKDALLGSFSIGPGADFGPHEVGSDQLCYREGTGAWHQVANMNKSETINIQK
jgi:hypothetical protein